MTETPESLPEGAELEAMIKAGELGMAEETVPAEDVAEKVAEAAPPNEPDGPTDGEEEMPDVDQPGIITALSEDMFKKLRMAWLGNGKPRRLTVHGAQWNVYDDGAKFVNTGAPGAMGDYGSLSTSSVNR